MFLEETIDCYVDAFVNHDNQQETVDQRTSQWIDDFRSVNIFIF